MRWWYVGRGVSWAPLLACCALAGVAALVGRGWPGAAAVLLPVELALVSAGAAFVFDEAAAPLVAVSPRGAWWRRSSRIALGLVPLGTWLALLALAPTALAAHRPSWVLAGVACLAVAVGISAWCSRRQVADPGASVAAAVVGAQLVPLVVGPLAGWDPVLPVERFGAGLVSFWVGVAVAGVGLVAWAVRPGLR